eukprot:14910989-Ditylum_brightwellii.AAC.1
MDNEAEAATTTENDSNTIDLPGKENLSKNKLPPSSTDTDTMIPVQEELFDKVAGEMENNA